jgi:ABC-2 type transport system ATP-binding protein
VTAAVVQATGLTKRFGDFTAVDSVTFSLGRGEVLGYLGPNGSGKTTTLRMLLGLLQPTSGRALMFGDRVGPDREGVRQRVGYMSQRSALYDELTVAENLAFYAQAYGVADPGRRDQALVDVGLGELKGARAGDLPTGWRQRLALAAALVHRPELLILDEPTSGVDPLSRRAFWDRIYELARQGVSAIVSTHYLEEAEYCQRIGVMIRGRLLALDEPARLKEAHVAGEVWEVRAAPLLGALDILEQDPDVDLAGLEGDHLRLVTRQRSDPQAVRRRLGAAGVQVVDFVRGEASLADVFVMLARA